MSPSTTQRPDMASGLWRLARRSAWRLSAGAPAVGVDSASHAVERLARAVGVGVSDAQASPPDRSDKRLKRAIEQTRGALTLLHGFHSHDDRSAGRGGSR